ncbi:MAG TPA: hypothetical protein VG937_39040 [Polyangiaceae bacterium]|nr:hypothetical protein [Polyangiaceae bacterium]
MNHLFALVSPLRRRVTRALSAALLCVACDGHDSHSTEPAGEGGASGTVSCVNDERLDSAEPSVEKAGLKSALWFRLEKTEPAPPSKGDNTFTVSVRDQAETAFTGELSAKAKMPDHGHESPSVPSVSFDADSAVYTIRSLNLFMAGVWQVTLSASDEAAASAAPLDSASFYFCIQG